MTDEDTTPPAAEPATTPLAAYPAGAAGPAATPGPTSAAWKRWVTPILAVVAALVIGLFGGILIGQATSHSQATGFTRPGGANGGNGGFGGGALGGAGQPGGGQGGGALGGINNGGTGAGGTGQGGQNRTPGDFENLTTGTIQSIDGTTITLKLPDGSTVKVSTSATTTVTKTSKATVGDLKSGERIVVRGAKGSDGSVAATSVTEGQGGFGVRPGGAGTGTGTNG
jgi:hypothetical protein